MAQEITFVAQTEVREVLVNTTFEVQFILRNSQGSNFEPPSFEGFEVVSGMNQSTSVTIVNGRRNMERKFGFMLLATRPGTLEIGPASVRAGGSTLRTQVLSINVVPQPEGTQKGGEATAELFMKAVIDTTAGYPGQQLRIDYLLYTTVQAHNFNILREDDYSDFHYRYVQDFDRRVWTEVVEGVQYKVHTLKSVALYPSKVGTYVIEPFVARVAVAQPDSRSSFFLMTRSIPRTLVTDSIGIEVLPLPEPQPESFSGAVGRYSMNVSIQDDNLSTDDALVLTVDIAGDGDPRRWEPPSLSSLSDRFEVYDPNIRIDETSDQRGIVLHRRQVEYLMVPREAGYVAFDIGFTYFNPDSGKYLTMMSAPVELVVKPGSQRKGANAVISQTDEGVRLRDLKSPGRLPAHAGAFIFTPLFFFLTSLPLIYLVLALRRRQKDEAYANLDPATRKRLEARKRAMKYVGEAKELMGATDKEYYAAITQAVFTYLSGKLGFTAGDLTKAGLMDKMEAHGLSQSLRDDTLKLLNHCEQVLYAGQQGVARQQETYETAVELIVRLDEQLH